MANHIIEVNTEELEALVTALETENEMVLHRSSDHDTASERLYDQLSMQLEIEAARD